MTRLLGSVAELWRYPVKSMQGERLPEAEIGSRGIVGDRHWGVVDASTGLVLTARREPALLWASARQVGDEVEIVLPDGSVSGGDDDLSAWLDRPVRLRAARPGDRGTYEGPVDEEHEDSSGWSRWQGPDGTFHDSTRTRVSVVSRAALGPWDAGRFRANVVLDGTGEDAWVGSQVRMGTVVLDILKHIDRCVVIARPQPGGIARDLDVLRTINRERGGVLGVGALVAGGGTVREGDPVEPL